MESALRLKVSERVSTCEERIVMSGSNCPDRRSGARPADICLRQARERTPADALTDEAALVGKRGGKIRIAVGLLLEHDVGFAAERHHELGRPLLDDDARCPQLLQRQTLQMR